MIRHKTKRVTLSLAGALMASALAMPAMAQGGGENPTSAGVTQARLENAINEPQNWLLQLGNYSNWSYSSLNEINRGTVRDLHVAFTLPITTAILDASSNLFGASQLENRPLVIDGTMYFNDAWGIIYAVDISDPSLPRSAIGSTPTSPTAASSPSMPKPVSW
jgi:glucose dehydrogenase